MTLPIQIDPISTPIGVQGRSTPQVLFRNTSIVCPLVYPFIEQLLHGHTPVYEHMYIYIYMHGCSDIYFYYIIKRDGMTITVF